MNEEVIKPKRKKTGGRQKGTVNVATAKKVAEIEQSGMTPLEFLLNQMRDQENTKEQRIDAAKSAAPYVHPKLANIDVGNKGGQPFLIYMADSDDEL